MKFSTKAEYGLRALVNLAQEQGFYSLAQIAKEEKISLAYLERLFAKLKKDNLVTSQKGSLGGYKLSRSAEDISVKDIFLSLEGSLTPYNCKCFDLPQVCSGDSCNCHVQKVWQKLDEQIRSTLEAIKLNDLIK